MADVLIVCVREDEPQAKALAEMFEAAGFSIGGAPSSDGALRSSGAGVIVWSQASIRSRPFLDAAQRVINAGKAVVASLIEPPPPSSIGSSPAFDLSHWDGDPNDPALDPLFFAVDRLVNAARAAVGATGPIADPQTYDPPPPASSRAPRQTAPPPQTSYRGGSAGAEPLGAEAEFWRAIRDSRNPSDFMDYLARYGPDGAFSEVAELRLKQLAGPGDRSSAPRSTPRAATSMPSSRPAARTEAPPPRMSEPPARRFDAPPPQRRIETPTPRRAGLDRSFGRNDDLEPPRGEGGALRAFVLIALLGAALAGGLYVGGGIDFAGASRGSQEPGESNVAAQPAEEPASMDAGEPESYSLSDATDFNAPPPAPAAARREPPRATPQAASRPAPARETEVEAPPPAPVTSWGSGGPLSLSPSEQSAAQASTQSSTQPTNVVPLAPPPDQTQLASVEPTLEAATPVRPATVNWTQRPTARRIADLYPDRAIRQGVGGRVQLDCVVQVNLSVACAILSENPPGLGFGRAALSAASSYRAQPQLSDGASAIGKRTRISVNFQAPQ